MKIRVKFAFVLVAMFIASGCIKYTYNLANVKPELYPAGNGSVAVASQDQRIYVVSGKNKPQLVGVIRGGFGNNSCGGSSHRTYRASTKKTG